MSSPASDFWANNEDYHELAKQFEENIEIDHPEYLSGRSGCGFCHHCGWAASTVKYYSYTGPALN